MTNNPLVEFGNRVRFLRTLQNITIEELAFRCNLHPNYIGEIERGKRNVSLINIYKIAKGLKLSVDALFIN